MIFFFNEPVENSFLCVCDIGLGLAGRGLRTEVSHIATTSALPEKEADIRKESRAGGWKCQTPP